MITDTIRQAIYQEIESAYPSRGPRQGAGIGGDGGGHGKALPAAVGGELATARQQVQLDLKEQLFSQILFHLHTLFDLSSADDATVSRAVREALDEMYSIEDSCGKDGPFDAQSYAMTLFRGLWHGGRGPREPEDLASLVSATDHLEQASFFSKTPHEIAPWARRFLMIERYYRLDAREHENRFDRYRSLHSRAAQSTSPVIHHFEDLLIWLQFRQLEEANADTDLDDLADLADLKERGIGALSRKISKELEGLLARDVLMGDPLQPTIYVLLGCLRYCRSETLDRKEANRLEELFATRQLDSLPDLMRVVLHKTSRDEHLPEARVILDQLQREKFNILHHGFRDPYEADLVSIDDTERIETARLPLFIPLGMLSGEYGQDFAMSRQMLMEWHGRILEHIIEDCRAFATALAQPIPQSALIYRAIRFAVSWVLSKSPWPVRDIQDSLEQGVKDLLPEHAVRHLVRPRKGYEIKSRQQLNQLIAGEVRRRRKALERAATRSIQGYYDYAQFTRYVTFQYLREKYGDTPGSDIENAGDLITEKVTIDWVRDMGKKWAIEAHLVHPLSLEPVQQYLKGTAPPERIIPELEESFATSHGEAQEIYQQVLGRATPVFFRLLVAYGRNRAKLTRLPASVEDIREMLILLAPPLHALEQISVRRQRQDFASRGPTIYRSQLRPYLLDAAEWEAYLAWQAKLYMESRAISGGFDSSRFLEVEDLDGLLHHLEQRAREVDLPPNALLAETVLSTLFDIIRPRDEGESVPEAAVQEVMALLPQLDCAACGQPACRDFARSLLAGRTEPRHCLQLSPERVPALAQIARRGREEGRAEAGAHSPSMLEVLRHRHLWRSSPDKARFERILSVHTQKGRRLFMERVKKIWHDLTPKPRIFKCPDMEAFYKDLHRYLGHEAAERLREDERRFLTAHGRLRQLAEWRLLKARQDWLTLANRNRRSRPLLLGQDAELVARESYDNVLFLHQLGEEDRELVLRYRLKEHQDGFSHWWNEDLLTMNHPEFSVRDWEDFSRVIKNAYWHQETSLAVEDGLSVLEAQVLSEQGCAQALEGLLRHWIDNEEKKLAAEREIYERIGKGRAKEEIRDITGLRAVIGRIIDEMSAAGEVTGGGSGAISDFPLTAGDRVALNVLEAWKRFQDGDFAFSPVFSCLWDELLAGEREALSRQGHLSGGTGPDGAGARGSSGGGGWVVSGWKGPIDKRVKLIKAVMSNAFLSVYREAAEWEYLEKDKGKPFLPPEAFRLSIRRLLRIGAGRDEIGRKLKEILAPNRDLQHGLLREALRGAILAHQYERLCRFNNSFLPASSASRHGDYLSETFPDLERSLETILDRHIPLDRERLLHYLFLLAKMEGNLDTLTALLREIRETSDVIEAAWLRFTQDRLVEGPGPAAAPSLPVGVPLLASRLKEKEPLNRGLKEGVSRKEKKNVASAVEEVRNIIRFHILLSMERHPGRNDIQSVLEDIQNAGYDLTGIDEEALKRAAEKEWSRKSGLEDRKIWIYTTVTARRLAAQHAELQEAEREFYKARLDLLKENDGSDGHHQAVAARRGVALGQVKEEMYRQLSDLLESERIATFQNRIRQIVALLDRKREDIYRGWLEGDINSRTIFYLLRQYQKEEGEPTWSDFERFLSDHWLAPLAELRASSNPDAEEHIRHLDDRFRALLGASLLDIESQTAAAADRDFRAWMGSQMERLESGI